MEITKVTTSRLPSVKFEQLEFGSTFTDHMFWCDYTDGEWKNPKITPYASIEMSPSASVLHYGQAVFEGMKAYKDTQDQVFLFRPHENFKRFNRSSKRLAIPEFPEHFFMEGLQRLLDLDRNWVKSGVGNSLYVRPFVFATQACVQAAPSTEYRFMIICSPVSSYYSENKVRVKIADHFSRAPQGGTGYAKAAGNYAGQFYPTQLAIDQGYQQVVWTDAASHDYIEEAGTMNLFFRINDTLLTAPISDSILDGVTRKSVIDIAKSEGLDMEVRPIRVDEIIAASKNNSLKEIFGAGTAVVIQPITGFGYKDYEYDLRELNDPYANRLKKILVNIQYNQSEDPLKWRFKI